MKLAQRLLWVVFFGLVLFLSLNRHSRSGRYNYHSEIWADKAGYMVYLPAAFCYGFDAHKFPTGIDAQTGEGFTLNRATDKLETKYPYGVALLQAPFWGAAQLLSPDKSGFSTAAHKAIDVAGATYFVLGLALVFATLRRQFSKATVIVTLTALVLGTNLWYYGIIETGMSHAYSFCAFALLLWLVSRAHIPDWGKRPGLAWGMAGIAATLGLISILRPLNLVLALPLLLWPTQPNTRWTLRLQGLLHWRALALIVVAISVCWVPQLLYYKYARGGYFVYSYGQEGFRYILSPRLAEVWFAPNNGALLYNPILLLALVPGIWLLARHAVWRSGLAAAVWLFASFLYASWWAYALGCSYGGRGFVDVYPVLAWPLAALVHNALARRNWLLGAICVCLVAYNMRLSLHFDGCFYGKHDWDWNAYQALLK